MTDAPTVLIVDDEPMVRSVLKDMAENAGFACWVAPSAEHALELVKTRAFDALVTDVSMPEMTGIEMLGVLHLAGRAVPSIVLSASVTPEQVRDAYAHGAVRVLLKPPSMREFQDALRNAVGARLRRSSTSGESAAA